MSARHCFDFDHERLGAHVAAMQHDPAAATLTIRSRHRWDGGFAVAGRTEEVAYADVALTQAHDVRTDWPHELGGSGSGPMAGQAGLAAVGACVAATYAAEAALRGVTIEDLEVTVEGSVDLRGAFELADVPVPFSGVAIKIHVTADADDAALEELAEASRRTSPMYQSFVNPVPMQVGLERRG